MVAYPLIFGELTAESYTDAAAADPRIAALRDKIECVEDPKFSVDYHEPEKRFISNALTITLNDGTVLDEVEIEYPVGHKRRVRFYLDFSIFCPLTDHHSGRRAHLCS